MCPSTHPPQLPLNLEVKETWSIYTGVAVRQPQTKASALPRPGSRHEVPSLLSAQPDTPCPQPTNLVHAGQRRKRIGIAEQASDGSGSRNNSGVTYVGPTADCWELESCDRPHRPAGRGLPPGVSTTGKTDETQHGQLHLLRVFPASQGGDAWPPKLALPCFSVSQTVPFPFGLLSAR